MDFITTTRLKLAHASIKRRLNKTQNKDKSDYIKALNDAYTSIEVTYNNKSRKGNYIRINTPHGTGLYKDRGGPLEAYENFVLDKRNPQRTTKGTIQQYIDTYTTKTATKQTRKILTQAKKYYQKIARTPTLKKHYTSGETNQTLQRANSTTKKQFEQHYKKHLTQRGIHKKHHRTLSQETNMQKMKQYYINELTLQGLTGQPLATIKSIGTKTPQQIIKDVKKYVKASASGKLIYNGKFNKLKGVTTTAYHTGGNATRWVLKTTMRIP